MYNTKTLMAAASLAVLSAAGLGIANAAPWEYHVRAAPMTHGHSIARGRLVEALRFHHYRAFGEPYLARGHTIMRGHDRFGRIVFVEVDPDSGAFLGERRF